jgi:hypothetical protein
MKKLVFVLPLALGLVLASQQQSWSQQTTTRTGPNGNSVTTTREVDKPCTKEMQTTRSGPNGNSVTTTRSKDCPENNRK